MDRFWKGGGGGVDFYICLDYDEGSLVIEPRLIALQSCAASAHRPCSKSLSRSSQTNERAYKSKIIQWNLIKNRGKCIKATGNVLSAMAT